MKKTNECPKCGSHDIRVFQDGINEGASYICLGITILSSARLDRYVCCSCGYVEHWAREDDLSKLKKKGEPVR
jgi:hypothetical protein